MGINARKALDPRWVSHNIRTIDGFKNCEVRIYRPTTATNSSEYDFDSGEYASPDGTVIYEGLARIQPYGINLDLEVALDPTARRLVLIQLQGKNLGIRTDDVAVVVSTTNNQDLLRYQFDIRGSLGSSLEWGTNLVTEVNLKVA